MARRVLRTFRLRCTIHFYVSQFHMTANPVSFWRKAIGSQQDGLPLSPLASLSLSVFYATVPRLRTTRLSARLVPDNCAHCTRLPRGLRTPLAPGAFLPRAVLHCFFAAFACASASYAAWRSTLSPLNALRYAGPAGVNRAPFDCLVVLLCISHRRRLPAYGILAAYICRGGRSRVRHLAVPPCYRALFAIPRCCALLPAPHA